MSHHNIGILQEKYAQYKKLDASQLRIDIIKKFIRNMKILVAILTHEGTQNNADACSKTWTRDIHNPHEYYFYGSKTQSEKMNKTWNCEPDRGEARLRLPEKTYKMPSKIIKT